MTFNANTFILAGTAIAIFGVGLYLWDTRKESVVNTYNQYRQIGGSRKHKRHKKSRKNKTYRKDR
jgi:hypothetical protein